MQARPLRQLAPGASRQKEKRPSLGLHRAHGSPRFRRRQNDRCSAASRHPELLRKSDLLIAIETSAMQPYAKQGDGCVIRIGDRTSVFNSSISYFITEVAERLARKDKTFKHQRALMPGGTCEATVY